MAVLAVCSGAYGQAVKIAGLPQQPRQHAPGMILTAKKHRKHPDVFGLFHDIEPHNRAAERDVAQAGHNGVMQGPAMRCLSYRFNIRAD